MIFQKIKSEGIAHYSYFLADGKEAVVIDPRRDIDVYLDLAREAEVGIRYVLETHRNEDYVIGSTALREATGAEIMHSKMREHHYGIGVGEGHEIAIGKLRLRVMDTPGHTLESLSFALQDTSAGKEVVALFSGDALFIGDVGRTDLLGEAMKEDLAAQLYETLHSKILPLGEGVILFPAHGGGSVCGGDISDREISSIGYEKLSNAFLQKNKHDFIQVKIKEPGHKPPYFSRMEEWNLMGNAPVYERLPALKPFDADEFQEAMRSDATVVDFRMPQAFASGHIPGSYNIWESGLSAYLGWIVQPGKHLLLVLPEHSVFDTVTRQILRIGYDEIDGYLRGGFESWQNSGKKVGSFGVAVTDDVRRLLSQPHGKVEVIDVRKPEEWKNGTIDGARNLFIGELEARIAEVPRDKLIVSMCSVGHRGGLAASILAKNGFEQVVNYLGGYEAWQAAEK